MYPTSILPRSFFQQSALHVARELLGKRLVHIDGDKRIGGIIIETEAYCGEDDLACHAKAGRTARTELMYGPAGHAYIYLNYGMHWLFNCVTASVGDPQAVLIRALMPTDGVEAIAQRRAPQPEQRWTDGPGKLTQALGIDNQYNGIDLVSDDAKIFIEDGEPILDDNVTSSPRVGLYSVPEPWKSIPWRFQAAQAAIEDYNLTEEIKTTGGTYEFA